jgi:AI-2 transport protein TqsA
VNAPPGPEHAPATHFYRRLHMTTMSLLLVVLVLYLMTRFDTLLQQLCIAALLGYLIVPLHRAVVRRGLSPLLSGVALLVGFALATYGLGVMLYQSFEELSDQLPKYQENLTRLVQKATAGIPGVDADLLERTVFGEVRSAQENARRLREGVGTFFNFAGNVVVVLVYLVFLLIEQAGFARRIETAFGPERGRRVLVVVGRINASITQYLAVKTFVSLLTGLLTTVVLLAFGVNYPILWGIVTYLLNYIPYLGSMVAVVLPVLLSVVQEGSLWPAVAVLVLLVAINNLIGFVVEPLMAGRRLDLSPLVILVSLALGGSVWGVVGMILAVPLAVVIKTILENIEETRPIAGLMAHADAVAEQPSPEDPTRGSVPND